ncbi:hypothetical protein BJV41_002854 [Clostridium beijerinckii]|jgi:hypothetical protein|nr:hypothetical protein [Clostridium beijerinckii]NOV70212.1 hypothetical protein [Clostridium beijerinckii]NOW30880.1 hypothetical protein [Clostridium beijerinckii]NOW86551.1 hypothetical protein [Clostridium beijerinckii]NRT78372.1 hypothetical protein [Clostridium beijerinckii]
MEILTQRITVCKENEKIYYPAEFFSHTFEKSDG